MRIDTADPPIEDRARGSMLGLLVGDALGVPVEGFPPQEVAEVAQSATGSPFLTSFIPAIQMGSVVTDGREIGYRWATEVDDSNFVATGPTDNPRLADFVRTGFFSDDGEGCPLPEISIEGIDGSLRTMRDAAKSATASTSWPSPLVSAHAAQPLHRVPAPTPCRR